MFKLIMKREDFSGSALVVYSPQMVMISEIKDKGSKITFTAVDFGKYTTPRRNQKSDKKSVQNISLIWYQLSDENRISSRL